MNNEISVAELKSLMKGSFMLNEIRGDYVSKRQEIKHPITEIKKNDP